jgi:hypothetical protein
MLCGIIPCWARLPGPDYAVKQQNIFLPMSGVCPGYEDLHLYNINNMTKAMLVFPGALS